jgi:5-methylcytosine-specific restriction enzyme subunit McrC
MTADSLTGVGVDPSPCSIIDCDEQGPIDVPLAQLLNADGKLDLSAEVESGDYFAVSLKSGVLTLRARGIIGYVPINNSFIVHVRPRVPVRQLARLIEMSGHPPTTLTEMRPYSTESSWRRHLLNVYAGAMIRDIGYLASAGMLQEYVRIEEHSSSPRGRLNYRETVTKFHSRGLYHKVSTARFERTPDVPVNRCIKYAIWLLCQEFLLDSRSKRDRRLHQRLIGAYESFSRVSLDHSLAFMSDLTVTGAKSLPPLRAYYGNLLSVSRAAIQRRGVSLEEADGELTLPSIVVNFSDVVEGYFRVVLRQYFDTDKDYVVVDGNGDGAVSLFLEHSSPAATPDIVIRDRAGQNRLVLEVKNIPAADLSSREAINQAVTYGVRYGLSKVVLVHPLSSKKSKLAQLRMLGTVGSIEVWQYQVDLAATDPVLEEKTFGAAIESLLL